MNKPTIEEKQHRGEAFNAHLEAHLAWLELNSKRKWTDREREAYKAGALWTYTQTPK